MELADQERWAAEQELQVGHSGAKDLLQQQHSPLQSVSSPWLPESSAVLVCRVLLV